MSKKVNGARLAQYKIGFFSGDGSLKERSEVLFLCLDYGFLGFIKIIPLIKGDSSFCMSPVRSV